MLYYVNLFSYILIPIAAIALFAISLYRYCSARKRNKVQPGSYPDEEFRSRKTLLIVASIILGALLAVVIGFMILIGMAVAYM